MNEIAFMLILPARDMNINTIIKIWVLGQIKGDTKVGLCNSTIAV